MLYTVYTAAAVAAVSTGKDVSCIVASPPLYSNTQIDRRYLATSRDCKKGTFSSPKNNLAIIGHHHHTKDFGGGTIGWLYRNSIETKSAVEHSLTSILKCRMLFKCLIAVFCAPMGP